MKSVGRKDPDQQWDAEDTAERDGIGKVHRSDDTELSSTINNESNELGTLPKGLLHRAPDPDATQTPTTLLPEVSDDTSLLLPLRSPIPRLLCLGLRHELAVLRLAVPATRFVIHTTIEIYPHLTASLSRSDFLAGCVTLTKCFGR